MMPMPMQMQMRAKPIGSAVLRLYQYIDCVTAPHDAQGKHDIEFWRRVIGDFFTEGAAIRYGLWNETTKECKTFEMSTSIAPRFYQSLFANGIRQMQILLENAREFTPNASIHVVDSQRACCVFWYENGCQVFQRGSIKAVFNAAMAMRMEMFDINIGEHAEYLPRSLLQPPSASGSPPPPIPQSSIPDSLVNDYGMPLGTMRCLEIAESVSQMRDLIGFVMQNKSGPIASLSAFVKTVNDALQQQQQQQQQQQARGGEASPSSAANGATPNVSPRLSRGTSVIKLEEEDGKEKKRKRPKVAPRT